MRIAIPSKCFSDSKLQKKKQTLTFFFKKTKNQVKNACQNK